MNVLCIRCYKATMAELPTLPLTPDGSHSGRCADSHQICQQKCGSVSGSRFTECHQICQQKWWGEFLPADLLTETKSTSRNSVGVFLPADILTVTKCTNRNRALFQLTDLLIVIKFANRNGRGAFLPADLLTVTRPDSINVQGNSASRFTDYQPNLPTDLFHLQFCVKWLVLMLSSYICLHLNICIQFLVQIQYYSLR